MRHELQKESARPPTPVHAIIGCAAEQTMGGRNDGNTHDLSPSVWIQLDGQLPRGEIKRPGPDQMLIIATYKLFGARCNSWIWMHYLWRDITIFRSGSRPICSGRAEAIHCVE